MALQIEKIHKVFADLQGSNIASSHPPDQIDRVLYMIIVDLFNKYYDHYVKTKKISDYLRLFKRVATMQVTDGIANIPEEYAHFREVYLSDDKTHVPIVEDLFWKGRVNSKINPPSASEPIARIEPSESTNVTRLQIVPSTGISAIKLYYFKVPTEPKYAYTISGSSYVYDEANSVDVEFPIGMFPDIVVRLLNYFGIKLREGQMIQVTEILKGQEQAK